ncbi:uncharacterized protein LOC125076001 [Vanessa atalanta]|uniref:uncharacterized protein LOC125076001 n=1 Tax=Vanessa atalanta TaxID=42275 RepID=UPI001FCD491B|nr:uncharacterized protein LOC125076001 [Vanessa atalanta]
MDKPCRSQDDFPGEDPDEEVMKLLPLDQMTIKSDDGEKSKLESEVEEKNGNESDLPSVEEIITECEKTLQRFLKSQHLERQIAAYQGHPVLDSPIDESSNVFIDFNKDLMEYHEETYYMTKKEKVIKGSFLFLSNLSEGWSYDQVKSFLVKEFGIKCLNTMPERLASEDEYKAVVKFISSQQLNQVVMSLKDKNLYDKFLFFSFDNIPITYYDSDSNLDTDSESDGLDSRPQDSKTDFKEA